MTTTNFNWKSFKDVSPCQRHQYPVSQHCDANGKQIVVSRYGEMTWDFYPYIPQGNLAPYQKMINWDITMPDGAKFSALHHSDLLESSKAFIWSLLSDPVHGKKRPSMNTIIAKAELLFPLLRWMIRKKIRRFRDLNGVCLEYVPIAAQSSAKQAPVSASTLHYRLTILEMLFAQRHVLHDAITCHPWPHETALALSGYKRSFAHRMPTTEVIPDETFGRIAASALKYVESHSIRILAALHDSKASAALIPHYGEQARVNARTDAARKAGYKGTMELRSESFKLRTACYIVIAMFSGLRDSEMMSLEVECISRQDNSQGDSTYWLHGEIYKTGHKRKRWLVPEICHLAVQVASKLTAPLRELLETELQAMKALSVHRSLTLSESKRLHTIEARKKKIFLALCKNHRNTISALAGKDLNRDLKIFCKEENIRGSGGEAYRLHSHQFRRTYARHIARSELGDLLTLKEHFGHWSLDMTAYYAEGAVDEMVFEKELVDLVASEKSRRQDEIVASLLSTDSNLANGQQWLNEWRSHVRIAKNKDEVIKKYSGTISLNGTGHSWCVGNARGIGCGGLCVFEAQSCVDCKFGIIGPEHRSVWEGIRDQQTEVLELNDVGPGGKLRAAEIYKVASKVLRRLNGKDEE